MENILAALIGAAGLIAAQWLANRKTRRAVQEVHDEVKTNHGKSASEYLEMVAEVKAGQDVLLHLLANHTDQDERNFKSIDSKLNALT